MSARSHRSLFALRGHTVTLSFLKTSVRERGKLSELFGEDVSLLDKYDPDKHSTHVQDKDLSGCQCSSLWLLMKYAAYLNAEKSDIWLPFQSRKKFRSAIKKLRQLHDCENDDIMHPYIAVPATLVLFYRAYTRNSLTPVGIVVAGFTAFVHAIHPWSLPYALLVVFFLAGTSVTKVSFENFRHSPNILSLCSCIKSNEKQNPGFQPHSFHHL